MKTIVIVTWIKLQNKCESFGGESELSISFSYTLSVLYYATPGSVTRLADLAM